MNPRTRLDEARLLLPTLVAAHERALAQLTRLNDALYEDWTSPASDASYLVLRRHAPRERGALMEAKVKTWFLQTTLARRINDERAVLRGDR